MILRLCLSDLSMLNQSIIVRLAGFYFCYYAIVGAFMPYWNLYLEAQKFSHFEIGLLSTIAVITRFFAPFIWGWLSDYTGKRMLWIRIATCVEAMIWLTIFFIDKKFQSIAIIMLIFSFFQNAILAQFEGVTLFWLGEKRQELYGKVRKWGSIGFIVGVLLIGVLLEWLAIDRLPLLLLCISVMAFVWSFLIKEPHHAPKAQKKLDSVLPILKRPWVYSFFIIEFILLFSHAPFYSFYTNYLHEYGFSSTKISVLWSVGVIAEIMMFACAHHLFKHYSWRVLIGACLIFTSLRWIIIGLFPQSFVWQFAAQSIHAFSFGLFHLIAMQVIFQNFSQEQQGRGQALYSTMWGLGVASGSLLAGYYWELWTGQWIFIAAGIITLLGLFFYCWHSTITTK